MESQRLLRVPGGITYSRPHRSDSFFDLLDQSEDVANAAQDGVGHVISEFPEIDTFSFSLDFEIGSLDCFAGNFAIPFGAIALNVFPPFPDGACFVVRALIELAGVNVKPPGSLSNADRFFRFIQCNQMCPKQFASVD
ncbi:hypothetical protein BA763_01930 [Burkholderia cenocepacia]|nr:hypothetical protein A3203_14705 [Burkholderia cenocepacia]AOK64581.1 hypothetical protein WM33_02900 [Burkholderia multivorans]KVS33307.1 hypothetical protein WK35_06070 [Burkholderia vietnamiensis]ODN62852.1 hypothetical protein BA763_24460 [Burkholderia cenocepacia]ODN65239.1 hypothetical protein BA763_01930 [Burkholderia cenocepacia]